MSLLHARGLSIELGGKVLFENLELEVSAGQRWGILGANGAGKTTLLHVLAGLRALDSGVVTLSGVDISAMPRKVLARQLGILFQDNNENLPLSVIDAVMNGLYPHKSFWSLDDASDVEQAMKALERVDLDAMAQREVATLSGGEQRRLALATLLLQSPRVCLLDEPTNHLDLHYQITLLDLVNDDLGGSEGALVMVLHDVNLLARYCTHALLMVDANEYIAGPVTGVINRDNLSRLYRHPVGAMSDSGTTLYYPV